MRGKRLPHLSPFLIHRGSASSLRNMMGVFPLADTMSRFSNPPLTRGEMIAPVNRRADEVWWHPDPPTNPRRTAAAMHSPIDYTDNPYAITRRPGTDPSARLASAGQYIRRAPTVRTSDRAVGSSAERGPPFATSRMPALQPAPVCLRHSSPVAAPAVLVVATGGTRMQ